MYNTEDNRRLCDIGVMRNSGVVDEQGMITVQVKPGSIILSPGEQQRRHEYWERQNERAQKDAEERAKAEEIKKWQNGHKKFYFAAVEGGYGDLTPTTVSKLFFLASYLSYDGVLRMGPKPIKRDDVGRLLGGQRSTVWRFLRDVTGKYVTEDENGQLHMPSGIFYRGKLYGDTKFQTLYRDCVRKLFLMTPGGQRKYLGYAFQLIPFVNLEYNVLCWNIEETEFSMIEPLSVNDLCALVGFSREHRAKLLRTYRDKIVFEVDGQKERLISVVGDGVDVGTAQIFINPHLLYHGSRPGDVEILGKFCQLES